MYRSSDLRKYGIQAVDGRIGSVTDFLFDDREWVLRWLVVDTGDWLARKEVLLPASNLGSVNAAAETIDFGLTTAKVEESPDAETNRPVSRQFESSVYDYYGWTPYWGGMAATGRLVPPRYLVADSGPPSDRWASDRPASDRPASDRPRREEDPHLRSVNEVISYHIEASDGEIGHVEGLPVRGRGLGDPLRHGRHEELVAGQVCPDRARMGREHPLE